MLDGFTQETYLRPEINGPVLGGEEAIGKMHIAKGYQLNLFAEEPHVINPVVMRFDEKGRLWIVEMCGYMNNLSGSKEMAPVGRISILEDSSGDGKMNKSTVFLDKLIEPRAMAFHKNGILWADHKKLYFTVIVNDSQPGKTVVVDEDYSAGHSVEHKPNGLVRAIDNWYYNAKSQYRYKEVAGKWLIEKTEYRGQFGLSADNHGRLYHGQQNTLLRAEVFPPNFFLRNPNLNLRMVQLATKSNVIQDNCFNIKVSEQAVYPVRKTKDIRDGYIESKDADIDAKGYAKRCTSACSHFYYRDDLFPERFSAFVVDPAMHFVKVVTIDRKNGIPFGKNAFQKEEIVASPDTRFRPVDVQSAPDGTLYIADMYHGVLQHRFFMNNHLRKFIKKNNLEAPEGLGRIYRLSLKDKKPNAWEPFVNPSLQYLVEALGSKNPWMRDTAQRILVDSNMPKSKAALEAFYDKTSSTLGRIHALWTLEGLGHLSEVYLLKALADDQQDVRIHAARLSWRVKNTETLMSALISAAPSKFNESSYYIYQRLANFNNSESQSVLAKAYMSWSDEPFFKRTLLSGSGDYAEQWIAKVSNLNKKKEIANLYSRSKRVNRQTAPKLQKQYLLSFNRGKKIFLQNCFSCHGKEGRGLLDMGPPLHKSDWVSGDAGIITKIILKGMEGEIVVSGKTYKPKIPMLAFEAIMTDKQIADVLTYIRNSWGNKSTAVTEKSVQVIRENLLKVKKRFQQSDFR